MSDRTAMKREPKLVRARPRSIEYLPDWAKCCQERIAATISEGELTLDISDTSGDDGLTCKFCGADMPNDPVARDVADDTWVHIAEYDLDEGVFTA